MAEECLNPNQIRRLTVTFRHIDKLLAEMESALDISSSKQAFPLYIANISSPQRGIVEQHIARVRSLLVRVLQRQGIELPEPSIPVSRFAHTVLSFAIIAVEELRPRYMRGYGEVSSGAEALLEDLVRDLLPAIHELDRCICAGTAPTAEDSNAPS